MLKKRYDSEDDIPEAARSFYAEDGKGSWLLGLDAGEDIDPADASSIKKQAKEFRTANIALMEQNKALQAKVSALGDIDPETIRMAMSSLARTKNDEELQLIQAGKLDEVVSRRTAAMQSNYQKQLDQLEADRKASDESNAKARQRFASVYLSDQVDQAVAKKQLSLRPTAKSDLLMRAGTVFAPDDDLAALVSRTDALDKHGKPLTVESWLDSMVDDAPHLFSGGTGGNARPGGGKRQSYSPSKLSPEEFAKAATEVNAGTAEWGS